jgi:hypothetical protein
MQPLDRMNAHLRRGAEAMRSATLQQRLENEEQRSRMHVLRQENQALRRRSCLDSVQDVGRDEAAGGWSFVPERRT